MIEPGHPWLMMSGSASSWRERTWMKWMSRPSISVSELRQRVQLGLDRAPVIVVAQ